MSVYTPNPDCDCRLCYHRVFNPGMNSIHCPVKKIDIALDRCTECGTECEDRDINQDWLNIDRAMRIGREYERTGDIRVFLRVC